jgi:hypothetical protein
LRGEITLVRVEITLVRFETPIVRVVIADLFLFLWKGGGVITPITNPISPWILRIKSYTKFSLVKKISLVISNSENLYNFIIFTELNFQRNGFDWIIVLILLFSTNCVQKNLGENRFWQVII